MRTTTCYLGLVTVLILAALAGCSPPAPAPSAPAPELKPPALGAILARLHWLGKQRLAAESNATNFIALWNLPESARLEAQTLDKLATAPWRLWRTNTAVSNAPTALLRPLLDDLVQAESYLEVRAATNQPPEVVLALRLAPDRAALWRTNLPVILQSITGSSSTPGVLTSDFRLQTSDLSFSLSRFGDWTLLSFARLSAVQPQPSGLLTDFAARIQRDHAPFPPPPTNYWLETEADLGAFAQLLPFGSALRPPPSAPQNLPRLALTLIGDGQNVRTRGELNFPSPLPIELVPWNIPTNLVHDPLIGFMGMRGIRPLLKSLPFWNEARLGTPPNQAFFWAQEGVPALRFFALPSAQASNQMYHLSEFLINDVNPRFAASSPTNIFRYGAFEREPDSPLLRWRGIPYIVPNLGVTIASGMPVMTGGLFRNLLTNRPAPDELIRQFQAETNLFFYDWELTHPSESGLIQMTQLGRLLFGRARLSITNNAALPWLVAIAPKLGISGTSLRLADASHLTFSRSSTLGLTGMEIHLLADWLESPTFPKGLFTLDASPVPLTPVSSPPPKTTQ